MVAVLRSAEKGRDKWLRLEVDGGGRATGWADTAAAVVPVYPVFGFVKSHPF
jgi:hypothetical protein